MERPAGRTILAPWRLLIGPDWAERQAGRCTPAPDYSAGRFGPSSRSREVPAGGNALGSGEDTRGAAAAVDTRRPHAHAAP